MQTLTLPEVREIYLALVDMFCAEEDPIDPVGERLGGMLESAVARQFIGLDGQLRFATPVENAVSLAYGICCNHAFHNGNKRTALVCLLVHLDRNGYIFREGIDHLEVYAFMLAMASKELHSLTFTRCPVIMPGQDPTSYDHQLACATAWVSANTRMIRRGDRPIRMRDLRRILTSFGFELDDPDRNFADIYKTEEVIQRKWLGMRAVKRPVRKKVFQISCAGMNQTVPVDSVKEVRRRCHLRDTDGVDSHAFYGSLDPLDYFLNMYRNILKKLARD